MNFWRIYGIWWDVHETWCLKKILNEDDKLYFETRVRPYDSEWLQSFLTNPSCIPKLISLEEIFHDILLKIKILYGIFNTLYLFNRVESKGKFRKKWFLWPEDSRIEIYVQVKASPCIAIKWYLYIFSQYFRYHW